MKCIGPDLVGHCAQRNHFHRLKYPQGLSLLPPSYSLFLPTGSESGWAKENTTGGLVATIQEQPQGGVSPAPPWVPASNCS